MEVRKNIEERKVAIKKSMRDNSGNRGNYHRGNRGGCRAGRGRGEGGARGRGQQSELNHY